MKEICPSQICTGCSLCVCVCSKKSITMQTIDNFGHLYPVINQQICIDCGLCKKVCPSLHPLSKQRPAECFAAWSKDTEDYKSSTSGGVASVLSQYIIKKGGVVYGCVMMSDVIVKHIRVDKTEDLYRLKGSKYVQSDISEVLPLIKKDIKDGKLVLFIGTPCQCGAVRNLFKEQSENLYLIDLICHGIPSQKFLKQHVLNKVGGENVDNVFFRDGNTYSLIIECDGVIKYKKNLRTNRYEDVYLSTFFDGYSFRDSCYSCQYAKPERAFDITIGDFWGLGKNTSVNEIPEHPNGCSVVLPVSSKGVELIQAIRDYMYIYPREVDEAIKGNDQLRTPFIQNKRIQAFRWLVLHGFGLKIYHWVVGDKIFRRKLAYFKHAVLKK